MNKRLSSTKLYRAKAISKTCFAYEFGNRITKLPIVVPNDTIYELCRESVEKMQKLGLADVYSTQAPKAELFKVQFSVVSRLSTWI